MCNIRGTKMHAVALDEAHEMLVSKDIKTSGLPENTSTASCTITLLEPRSVSSSKRRSPHLADQTAE